MKPVKLVLSVITVLFLLSCSLFTQARPDAPSPVVELPTEIPTEAEVVVTSPPIVETVPQTEVPVAENNFGQIARFHLEALTAIGARVPGSENERRAAAYITVVFAKLGYAPETTAFSAWDENDEAYTSQNVIAVKQGTSSKGIIVGAHYDSGKESLGADDNASGVSVMLEVAERVVNIQTPYTIVFVAFGSEENDLDGSYYFAARMEGKDVDNTLAMINLDSIAAGDHTYVYSDEGDDAFLRDWVLEWAAKNDLPLQTIRDVDLEDEGDYVADYGAFADRGIPWIYFEATNWTLGEQDGYTQVDTRYGDEGYIWHTQYDNLEYLDATFPGRVNEHLRIFVSSLFAIVTEYQ
ncbi:MAG: M28 family peptidase [Chloroflexota bacterium]